MSAPHKPSTIVSTKGQVILPKAVRERQRWGIGTRLSVEEIAEGVLLRTLPAFPETRHAEVFGCAAYSGPALSLDDMDAAVARGMKRQFRRRAGS